MSRERELALARGPLWDDAPHLYFKAFLLREAGKHGATENGYSSMYLWEHEDWFAEFLSSDRFQLVIDLYGRPDIPTWVALDARRGADVNPRFAYIEDLDIAPDRDARRVLASEVADNGARSQQDGTSAAVVAVDTRNWRVRRIVLSSRAPGDERSRGVCHQIFYLAQPLLRELPTGDE
mgnify:CR=1 FL=1|jgi:hypothetical protein